VSSKRLDPDGLAGAFAPEPKNQLDFLIPPKPDGEEAAPKRKTARKRAKKTSPAKKTTRKKKTSPAKKTTRKKKTSPAKKSTKKKASARKTTRKAAVRKKTKAAASPPPARAVEAERPTLRVLRREPWAPTAPAWSPRLRERFGRRIDAFVARVLRLVA